MDEVRFRRLRWSSKWMILGVPGTVYGLWCFLSQFWYGFHAIVTLQGLLFLWGFGPCVWYGLETVHITAQTVILKLGPFVLRSIPVGEIRTVTSAAIAFSKGGGFCENLVFLSPRRMDEMIFVPSERPRAALHKYFETQMKHIYMHPREGIWLQYTGDEIAKLFPNAENFILKSEKA